METGAAMPRNGVHFKHPWRRLPTSHSAIRTGKPRIGNGGSAPVSATANMLKHQRRANARRWCGSRIEPDYCAGADVAASALAIMSSTEAVVIGWYPGLARANTSLAKARPSGVFSSSA